MNDMPAKVRSVAAVEPTLLSSRSIAMTSPASWRPSPRNWRPSVAISWKAISFATG
ncbi:hypothetical protein HED55_14030 [Ochrobactrum haematophilum]|uniref:Uncharacterized protein n=1 Tax=Brucella haematophila TaxID=419474 RepID=A0ABX1DQZ1_9HYPH|nr:hypothetical protein [Brucella haematophila]